MDVMRVVAAAIIAIFVVVPIAFAIVGLTVHMWRSVKARRAGRGNQSAPGSNR